MEPMRPFANLTITGCPSYWGHWSSVPLASVPAGRSVSRCAASVRRGLHGAPVSNLALHDDHALRRLVVLQDAIYLARQRLTRNERHPDLAIRPEIGEWREEAAGVHIALIAHAGGNEDCSRLL